MTIDKMSLEGNDYRQNVCRRNGFGRNAILQIF
jgi:hypothetical protein